MARRRIEWADGDAALSRWADGATDRTTVATAVRYALEELTARAPGNSVEVRVPPFGVAQCVAGPRHTRGTPPNVIETDAATFLALVTGRTAWVNEREAGTVAASGTRADLADLLPLWSRFATGSS
ncbi:sterol carrier family protein [Tersicoccus sp. MR15.9]|uniref:sterol carrier family protein n=1 Tax=Tersicoccus mangrovi TaxID=3121635 RepID=UPI002FE530EA